MSYIHLYRAPAWKTPQAQGVEENTEYPYSTLEDAVARIKELDFSSRFLAFSSRFACFAAFLSAFLSSGIVVSSAGEEACGGRD